MHHGHIFHPICIDGWSKKQKTCPLCRKDFVELVRQEQAAGRLAEEVKLEEVKLEESVSEGYLEAVREVNRMLLEDSIMENEFRERRGSHVEENHEAPELQAPELQAPSVLALARRRSI